MKNILSVFFSDCKRVGRNVVAVVVVMGLTILPSLYAWFNILSNWDPYGTEATSKIKVSVASDDKGLTFGDEKFSVGDSIIDALKTNDTIGWVFTDSTEEAVDGVYAGDYYAALIITEDFTKDMVSFMADSVTNPEIIYYTNQKKNAIAPKITDKAKTAVQQQVNATFVSKLTETLLKAAGTADNISGINIEDIQNGVVTSDSASGSMLDLVAGRLDAVYTQLESYNAVIGALSVIVDTASNASGMAENMSPDISNMLNEESDILNGLEAILNNGVMADIGAFGRLASGLGRIQSAMQSVSDLYGQIGSDLIAFNNALVQMGSNLSETKAMIDDLQENIEETLQALGDVKNSGEYQLLSSILSLNAEDLGDFVASPVQMDSVDLYPIANYGSAMSSFYTVLALWVGALILVAIIHVQVKSIEPCYGVDIADIKPYQAFFGRYITFFIIGQMQALLATLGNMLFINIQCVNPLKFWFAAAVTSFVFTLICYSLTVAFENVGEALAVVIMVIQVAGAGGTFPIEVLPKAYQAIYQFLPFTHAMDALRECVAGFYSNYYYACLGKLMIYAVLSLFIGLVLAIPCRKLNRMIEKSKEQSGVMI